jgi:hypothetical protein
VQLVLKLHEKEFIQTSLCPRTDYLLTVEKPAI